MDLGAILEGVTLHLPWAGLLAAALVPLVYRWRSGLWFPSRFTVAGLPPILSWLFAAIWLALFVALTFGMFWVIARLFNLAAAPAEDPADLRWYLLTLTAHTAALGAVVALPFTVLKANATERQTRAAEEQAQHNALVLFNENMNVTAKDLQARRQITIEVDGAEGPERYKDTWQDDIIMRCTAIDRLEGLATEKPDAAPRIARLLCVYLRELSRIITPENSEHPRADMQLAAQTLGRLKRIEGAEPEAIEIDLRGANLAGFDLSSLCFNDALLSEANLTKSKLCWAEMQGADLSKAKMQGAGLSEAEMQGAVLRAAEMQGVDLSVAIMQGADLSAAKMHEANLSGAEMQGANLCRAKMQGADFFGTEMLGADIRGAEMDALTDLDAAVLQGAALSTVDYTSVSQLTEHLPHIFGDASVTLPGGIHPDHKDWPPHWPKFELYDDQFETEWRKWQSDPASYTPPEKPA